MIQNKSIQVVYKLYESQQEFTIPISYEILEEEKRTVYRCRVALAQSIMPSWLTLQSFDIPKVDINGVTITCFSEVTGMKTIDTSLFVVAVEQAIVMNEMVAE